jgi:lysophospholipase L1-like esterase
LGSLYTWAFNEYAVTGPEPSRRAFQLDADIGDFLLLLLSDERGDKIGLCASVEPGVSSAVVEMKGDQTIAARPLDSPSLSRGSLHRLEGYFDGRDAEFRLDGRTVGRQSFAGARTQWIVANGMRSSEFARYAVGADPNDLKTLRPWQIKRLLAAGLAALVLLFLFFSFHDLGPRGRPIVAVILLLLAAPLLRPSMAMLASIGVIVLGGFGWTLAGIVQAARSGRKSRAARRRTLALGCLVAATLSCLLAGKVARDRAAASIIVREPRADCGPAVVVPPAARPKSVVVYGSSTAFGEGLRDPSSEGFPALLARRLGGAAKIESKASRGAAMRSLLRRQQETPDAGADLVLLYSTFNDAMFADGSFWDTIAAGRLFDLYKFSYDPSNFMRDNYAHYRPKYEERLAAFVSAAKQRGAKALLVGEVCADQVMYARRDHAIRLFYDSQRAVAEREAATFLDVSEDFYAHRDDVLFIDAMHLNARGHCLLADSLAPVVTKLLLE